MTEQRDTTVWDSILAKRMGRGTAGPADTAAALRQLGAMAMGEAIEDEQLHPTASALVESYGRGFPALASACIEVEHGPGAVPITASAAIQAAATSTASFGDVLLSTATGYARRIEQQASADVLALTAPMPVSDYKPASFSHVDLADLPIPSRATTTGGQRRHLTALTTGETFRVETASAMLSISREAMANDDRGYLQAMLAAYVAAAARVEAGLAFALLNDNDTLADGVALFASATSNLLTATALDADGFAAAAAALAEQETLSGEQCMAKPALLVVPPALLATALSLNESHGQPVRVIASPVLSAGVWYLMAEPTLFPVLARVTFEDSVPPGSSINFETPRPAGDVDAMLIPATHSVGFAAVSRIGAVRIETT